MPASANLMVIQGGGPTAVFNASLSAALQEARRHTVIGSIFGARFGVKGLVENDIADLTGLDTHQLNLLRNSPGAALGSSRHKPSDEEMERIVHTLKQLDVRYLLFMGGNGTMRGAQIVTTYCRAAGMDIQAIGVPKTVDNDIAETDRCPGYASAARYIAQATRELGADLRSLPQPVTVLETMGRNVGWLAAASTLAIADSGDAPHLVYVPELPFDRSAFLGDLDRIVGKHGWAVVVVSEGIRDAAGKLVFETVSAAQADPLKRPMTSGVGQHLADFVAENLGIRCRSEKPGLLGRCSVALVSRQDLADAEAVGRAAVQSLARGETDKMVTLLPLDESGGAGTGLVDLEAVAGHEHPIPAEWLSDGPLAVNDRFREYLSPLIGELTPFISGFPGVQSKVGVQ
ncbi:MAG: diphosphate--fructose-6-phosphate 1-phosphotransferase [Acidobacteria bacterium]|nr:diphosphate--fructose-6-phosphate 1-phosphotransferase [Acidobacteriota bacterium]